MVTVVDKMHDERRGHVGSGEAVEWCERKMEAGPKSRRQWEVLVGEKSRELTGHPTGIFCPSAALVLRV